MENLKVVKSVITIDALVSSVWDALVNPEKTKIYMFGCEAISDWEVGSQLDWQANYEGKDTVFVKGKIVVIEPEKLLKYTVINPFATYPDVPENYLNVTYKLEENDGKTTLTVTQDGFETAAEGEKRYIDTYNNGEGWNPILLEIKKVAETN